MAEYQATVEIAQPVPAVFDYVHRPHNLVRLLAGSAEGFESRVPEVLQKGSRLQFCFHRFGMQVDLVFDVVEFELQRRIFLQQTKGPFHRWLHEYVFEEPQDKYTRMTERVIFEPPSGFLGMFITKSGVMDQLKKRIPNSHLQLQQQFSNPAP